MAQANGGDKGGGQSVVTIPVDTINEMIVIAAALVDDALRDQYLEKEPPELFSDDDHGLIWDAMRTVVRRGKGFDVQQLHAEISGKVKLDYLRLLVERYPKPPVNMGQHIGRLRWDYLRRTTAKGAVSDFLRALKDPQESPAAVQGLAESVSSALKSPLDRSFLSNPKLIADKQREQIRLRRQGYASYPYGIRELDFYKDGKHRLIPGCAPGLTTVITGASGSGKSVVAAMIGLQQARMGHRVAFGGWEMGAGPTLEMMAAMSYTVPEPGSLQGKSSHPLGSRYAVSTGALDDKALEEFHARMATIAEWVRFFEPPFFQDPSRKFTNDQALAEIYRMVAESGCEVVVYDLFERCMPDGSPDAERRALFAMQHIHQRLKVHGIMLAQQKIKEIERRPDKRPTRETIYGSAAWVEIADTILAMYRSAHAKNVPDDSMEIIVLKQRFGKWPQSVLFDWDGDAMSLKNGRDVEYEFTNGGGFDKFLGGAR